MSNMQHFPKYSIVKGGVKVELNLDKYSKRFEDAQANRCYMDAVRSCLSQLAVYNKEAEQKQGINTCAMFLAC